LTGPVAATVALAIYGPFFLVAFIIKSLEMKRQTGFSGFHGVSAESGLLGRISAVLIAAGAIGGFLAPVLVVTGTIGNLEALEKTWIAWVGLAAALLGATVGLAAQRAMGASWRIGVEAGEETTLVVSGPFRFSRNPFFGALIPLALGLFLLVPNQVSLVAGICLIAGIEIQVRVVEEPHLRTIFGADYEQYGRRVGRFLPWIGRFR
jgi:protein-S-isoprenylcysteine O-methyltransferase Ste14